MSIETVFQQGLTGRSSKHSATDRAVRASPALASAPTRRKLSGLAAKAGPPTRTRSASFREFRRKAATVSVIVGSRVSEARDSPTTSNHSSWMQRRLSVSGCVIVEVTDQPGAADEVGEGSDERGEEDDDG